VNGDEIAIVGMAGRFPGAGDVATFWRNLLDAVDSAGAPTPAVTDFDPAFFGFGADEAARTDPQHRMFLELAWEALEDSGHDVTRLDAPAGVFGSASANQYQFLRLAAGAPPAPFQSADHLPAQVAYRLGLTGPAVAVQTACSGALVAVCLAAASLADFRCDLALAGGTNVNLPGYPHSNQSLMSPDGVCRAFDAAGQGAGFATGAGAVVLRRLADAQADRDHIYAVLRGSAVTNDGANRGGFAVPGVDGQAAAVAEALAVAEVDPAGVGLVEAHGSGTRLGDAIEVAALRRVYRDPSRPVALGSVKTNIGYLDAACGIAGLIKAALAVGHGMIPANLHYREPNPEIDFGPFTVPTRTQPWPDQDGLRIAGVSAFGVGGTNAHVVLAQPPPPPPPGPGPVPASGHPLPLSAASPEALREAAARLGRHLAEHRPALADVAFTLDSGRARLPYRATVTATDLDGALVALARLADPANPLPAGDGPPPPPARRVPLPGYPFQRQRCWADAPVPR
jgi:acyl transferase domain-containing protein